MNGLWTKISERLRKTAANKNAATPRISSEPTAENDFDRPGELLARLRDFLLSPGEPDGHLNPKWLAARLGVEERDLLNALAYAVYDGLIELHWEVFCPACGKRPAELDSLAEACGEMSCPACGNDFDVHLDRDVRVTFSATEGTRRESGGAAAVLLPNEDETHAPTRGLDLLLVPSFRKLFAGEAPPADESLKISRVAILFTDLRGSTAIYAERGDPGAYRMVRDHFGILREAVERNNGVLIKTIGDSVMATFAGSVDAVRAGFEAQKELCSRIEEIGGELVLKAGVHAGACLVVKLNEQLDFFGGAVNTAARVQGLSRGNDLVITNEAFAETESDANEFVVSENFNAELRGLPEPIRVHRLVAR